MLNLHSICPPCCYGDSIGSTKSRTPPIKCCYPWTGWCDRTSDDKECSWKSVTTHEKALPPMKTDTWMCTNRDILRQYLQWLCYGSAIILPWFAIWELRIIHRQKRQKITSTPQKDSHNDTRFVLKVPPHEIGPESGHLSTQFNKELPCVDHGWREPEIASTRDWSRKWTS